MELSVPVEGGPHSGPGHVLAAKDAGADGTPEKARGSTRESRAREAGPAAARAVNQRDARGARMNLPVAGPEVHQRRAAEAERGHACRV